MKKALRIIIILLIAVVIAVAILAIVAPNDVTMERSVTINTPHEVVTNQMFHFQNFHNWSPWQELDTAMTWEVTGTDGAKDAKYSWKGNDKVGKGEMIMTDVTPTQVTFTLNFLEPWESHATGTWKVEDAGNGTSKASWSFNMHCGGFPHNVMMLLFKGSMEKDFDKGLGKLKTYCEAHAKDMPAADFKIETINFEPHTYACIKKHMTNVSEDSFSAFFMSSYPKLGAAVGPNIIGPAAGLFFTWDEKNGTTDMAAAFPVKPDTKLKGFDELYNVPASEAYKVMYQGGYSGSGAIHQALTQHMAKLGKEKYVVVEEYIKGPGEDKDSTKWVTNIIYIPTK